MASVRVGTRAELESVYATGTAIDTAWVGDDEWCWEPSSRDDADDDTVGAWSFGRWKRRGVFGEVFSGAVDVQRYNAVPSNDPADAATNTSAIQAAIDANKGGTIVLTRSGSGRVYYIDPSVGLWLDGSAYDDTRIICEGAVIKLSPNTGAANLSGKWVGLVVRDCDDVELDLRFDGNRANMTATEQIICVGVAGATDLNVRRLICREIRGDGLYISQGDWAASSTVPKRITIGEMKCFNSSDDGRNAISAISYDTLTISSLTSVGVGGVIGGVRMPGGLDVEPNHGYHTCANLVVGSANIVSAGTSGFGLVGKAVTNDATRDWCIDGVEANNVHVQLTNATGQVTILRAAGVKGSISVRRGGLGAGFTVDYADKVTATLKARDVTVGVYLGYDDEIRNCHITPEVSGFSSYGVVPIGVKDTLIDGQVSDPGTGARPYRWSQSRGGCTQERVTYATELLFKSGASYAYSNATGANEVTFSDCEIRGPVRGWSSLSTAFDGTSQYPIRRRVPGLSASSAPTGNWRVGDTVPLTTSSETDGSDWVCTTGGASPAWMQVGTRPQRLLYTPTVASSAGDFVLGDGTVLGRYTKFGKQVTANVKITGGSTTQWGTGYFTITLPSQASSNIARQLGRARLYDASALAPYFRDVEATASATTMTIKIDGTDTPVGGASGSPFTFTNGDADEISLHITYVSES